MSEKRHPTGLDQGIALPSYPKAFFEKANINIEEDRVFVVMPFAEQHSKRMWRVLQRACTSNHLRPFRADSSRFPKPILIQILEEIGRAGIIIGDLTRLNPNVLYEVGIAHCRSENVILVSPRGERLPFDLAAIRCVFYEPHSPRWPEVLTRELIETIAEIRKGRPPVFIEDPLERTLQIVTDLETLGKLPDDDLKNETVWMSAFMSALAISKDEDYKEDKAYHAALLREKDSLLDLARRGCRLRVIINPPGAVSTPEKWKEHALLRSQSLFKFIRSKDRALRNIDWCISPMRQKNIYVIGKISCIEGFKDSARRGFHLSARQTASDAIDANVRLFESLFSRLCGRMLPHSRVAGARLRNDLRSCTTKALRQSIAELRRWK
jgi:hypothetical protein